MSLEYQIKGIVNSLVNETAIVRNYENARFLTETGIAKDTNEALQQIASREILIKEDIRLFQKDMAVDINNDLAINYGISNFNNFSINYCNFFRLLALQDYLNETGKSFEEVMKDKSTNYKIKKIYDKYFESSIASKAVKLWRNKVAAHFAMTDKQKNDNIATLNYQLSVHPTLCRWFYTVGGSKMSIDNKVSQYIEWSLTIEFVKLCINPKTRTYFEGVQLPSHIYSLYCKYKNRPNFSKEQYPLLLQIKSMYNEKTLSKDDCVTIGGGNFQSFGMIIYDEPE